MYPATCMRPATNWNRPMVIMAERKSCDTCDLSVNIEDQPKQ